MLRVLDPRLYVMIRFFQSVLRVTFLFWERRSRNAYFASFHLRLYSEKLLGKPANLIQRDT